LGNERQKVLANPGVMLPNDGWKTKISEKAFKKQGQEEVRKYSQEQEKKQLLLLGERGQKAAERTGRDGSIKIQLVRVQLTRGNHKVGRRPCGKK